MIDLPLLGREFIAAYECSQEVEAELILGDRPIEITLRRAYDALTPIERGRLLTLVLSIFLNINVPSAEVLKEKIDEAVENEASLATWMNDFENLFPTISEPLIRERDRYMAWVAKRSKAVNGKKRVVLVAGRGHIDGILKAIKEDQGGDTLKFKELIGKVDKETSRSEVISDPSCRDEKKSSEIGLFESVSFQDENTRQLVGQIFAKLVQNTLISIVSVYIVTFIFNIIVETIN